MLAAQQYVKSGLPAKFHVEVAEADELVPDKKLQAARTKEKVKSDAVLASSYYYTYRIER